MDPAIALEHGPLEHRPYFLDHLTELRIPGTSTSTPNCEECERPCAKHSPDSYPDHIVKFRCKHICGEKNARDWLFDRNYCKECKTVLFLEIPVKNDLRNIRRTWSLMALQIDHDQNDNEDMKQRVQRMWRKLLDDRAEAFLEGKVQSPKTEYGLYAVRTPLMTEFPPGFRKVNADVLITWLEKVWETLFKTASKAAVATPQNSGTDRSAITGLQVPCHPLAVKLLHHMIEVLRRYDGRLRRAERFHVQLNDEFVKSEINAQWHELAKKKEGPHGFFIYQRHLVEAVISEFTLRSELVTPQPRLGEWEIKEEERCSSVL